MELKTNTRLFHPAMGTALDNTGVS
jgi:hypothetical protein